MNQGVNSLILPPLFHKKELLGINIWAFYAIQCADRDALQVQQHQQPSILAASSYPITLGKKTIESEAGVKLPESNGAMKRALSFSIHLYLNKKNIQRIRQAALKSL